MLRLRQSNFLQFLKIMKLKHSQLCLTWACVAFTAYGQGTFIYDQQSSDESNIAGGVPIQTSQPLGQSFTPSLSAINFIRLYLGDLAPGNGLGATLLINLRTNSVIGPILGSTDPVFLADGIAAVTNLFFATPVALLPGTIYYFQPAVLSGDGLGTAAYNAYNYPGGMEFRQGLPIPSNDLWFREGLYVPEPSAAALAVLGVAWFSWRRRLTNL